MMWLRKSKKGFTLVELMVVVAIIGILALLGLRLFLMQQVRARNAIVKANAATVHTIIQGNLADTTYASETDPAGAAIIDIRDMNTDPLPSSSPDNEDMPAGMKNPHQTALDDFVIIPFTITTEGEFPAAPDLDNVGIVLVAQSLDTTTPDKYYVIGVDQDGIPMASNLYIAMK